MHWLTDGRVFPVVIMILQLAASARWLSLGNTGQSLYWFAATLLVGVVTFALK